MSNVQIEIGTKLYCNWGAMHPTEEAVITELSPTLITYVTELGDTHRMSTRDLRSVNDGNRSPIGVYLLSDFE